LAAVEDGRLVSHMVNLLCEVVAWVVYTLAYFLEKGLTFSFRVVDW